MEDLTKRIQQIRKTQEQINIIDDYRQQKQKEYWIDKCHAVCAPLRAGISTFCGNLTSCSNQGFRLDLENLEKQGFRPRQVFSNHIYHDFIGFEYKNDFTKEEYHVGVSDKGMLRAFYNNGKEYVQTDVINLPEEALKELSKMLEALPAFLRYEDNRMSQFVKELDIDTKKKLEECHFTMCYGKDSKKDHEDHEEYGE